MPEPLVRLIVVAGALGAAALVVMTAVWWRRRRAEAEPLVLDAVAGNVILLSDSACRRCDRVREMLIDSGADFTEIGFGDEGWNAIGATAVPHLIVRDGRGDIAGRAGGVPSPRRLAALLRRTG